MSEVLLKVEKRQTGKQISKKYRKQGLVPGIYYYKGSEALPIITNPKSLRNIVYTARTKVVQLEIEGNDKPLDCVLKDVSFNPVTDQIVHFDLMGIQKDQKFTVEVPVTISGQSIGALKGGIVQRNLYKVQVTCKFQELPDAIYIDITNLDLNHSITIKDLNLPHLEFVLPPETILVSVSPSRMGTKAAKEGEK